MTTDEGLQKDGKHHHGGGQILHSPYNFSWEIPNVGNLTKYIIEQALRFCDEGFGDKKWITNVETGKFVTISEVEPLTRRLACHLRNRGMKSGDIFLFNSHEPTRVHLMALGVWRAGGSLRSIYPQETADTVSEIVQESGAKWFLVDPDNVKVAMAACKKVAVKWSVEIIVTGKCSEKGVTIMDKMMKEDAQRARPFCIDFETGDHTAIVLPTSGTVGGCKGCVYTQAQGLRTLIGYRHRLFRHNGYGPPFKILSMARPTHIGGFFAPLASLVANKEFLMMPNVTKKNIFWAIHQHQPDGVAGFPSRLLHLLDEDEEFKSKKFDLTSIKFVISSGAPVPKNFVEGMQDKFGATVINIYGMTEASGSFVSNKNFDPATQLDHLIVPDIPPGSSGKLLPGTLVQVRDIEDDAILSANQQGELCFRSPLQCAGYFKSPHETATTFSKNGWIRSGDIGYFDDEGFIFVVNRLKECFKYFNNHISPNELEMVIREHPSVDECCVVGVTDHLHPGNSIPRAFVTLKSKEEGTAGKHLAEEIRKLANEKLASYKQLRGGLFILGEMPLGKTAKIDTRTLRDMKVHSPK